METTETLTELTARVANAMESAIAEYGPDAVNLALWAYQIEAIRYLGVNILYVCLMILVWFFVIRFKDSFWEFTEGFVYKYESHSDDTSTRTIFRCIYIGIPPTLTSLVALDCATELLSPAHWIAAFGSPELLIATKALQSAGAL